MKPVHTPRMNFPTGHNSYTESSLKHYFRFQLNVPYAPIKVATEKKKIPKKEKNAKHPLKFFVMEIKRTT